MCAPKPEPKILKDSEMPPHNYGVKNTIPKRPESHVDALKRKRFFELHTLSDVSFITEFISELGWPLVVEQTLELARSSYKSQIQIHLH